MSEEFSINDCLEKYHLIEKPSLNECVFNSKLFIDIDSTYEQSLNNSTDKESENSEDIDNIENENLLIKELIDELDSPKEYSFQEDNSPDYVKSVMPLINKGYEFIPKSYRNKTDKKKFKIYNKYNILPENNYKFKHKNFKERKGDWFCKICKNLNFAFRTECNRCKLPKEKNYLKKPE